MITLTQEQLNQIIQQTAEATAKAYNERLNEHFLTLESNLTQLFNDLLSCLDRADSNDDEHKADDDLGQLLYKLSQYCKETNDLTAQTYDIVKALIQEVRS